MSFRSLYHRGFVRVAACTTPAALADPAANAAAILAAAQQCHEQAVALAVFPELALSAYAIDDLLLQDALLDAVERALADLVAASQRADAAAAGGRAAAPAGTALQQRAGHPPRPAARGGAQESTCPTTANSTSGGISPRATASRRRDPPRRAGGAVRDRSAVRGRRTCPTSSCTPRSARTSGCRSRPAPGRRWRARRCWPTSRPATSRSARPRRGAALPVAIGALPRGLRLCRGGNGRIDHRPRLGRPGRRSTRTASCWPRPNASRPARACAIADVDLGPAAAGAPAAWARSTTTGAAMPRAPAFRRVAFALGPAATPTSACGGRVRPLPVRAGRSGAARPGLLRGLQHPGVGPGAAPARRPASNRLVIGVSGGLDSTQALIVAAQAFDLLGLPRTNILGFTMPGFATSEAPRPTRCG